MADNRKCTQAEDVLGRSLSELPQESRKKSEDLEEFFFGCD